MHRTSEKIFFLSKHPARQRPAPRQTAYYAPNPSSLVAFFYFFNILFRLSIFLPVCKQANKNHFSGHREANFEGGEEDLPGMILAQTFFSKEIARADSDYCMDWAEKCNRKSLMQGRGRVAADQSLLALDTLHGETTDKFIRHTSRTSSTR